ncbi:unnamed protein product, partial [Amoebophrya sp. A25]|eukprot:GSA25T00008434001.1
MENAPRGHDQPLVPDVEEAFFALPDSIVAPGEFGTFMDESSVVLNKRDAQWDESAGSSEQFIMPSAALQKCFPDHMLELGPCVGTDPPARTSAAGANSPLDAATRTTPDNTGAATGPKNSCRSRNNNILLGGSTAQSTDEQEDEQEQLYCITNEDVNSTSPNAPNEKQQQHLGTARVTTIDDRIYVDDVRLDPAPDDHDLDGDDMALTVAEERRGEDPQQERRPRLPSTNTTSSNASRRFSIFRHLPPGDAHLEEDAGLSCSSSCIEAEETDEEMIESEDASSDASHKFSIFR